MPAGNDIVAWRHARCQGKSGNQRFLDKVCSQQEQEYILGAQLPDLALWRCWSLKEAAYKLSCFLGNRQKFHPRRFTVHPGPDLPVLNLPAAAPVTGKLITGLPPGMPVLASTISWEGTEYAGFSIMDDEWVCSIAVPRPGDMEGVYWAVTKDIHTDKNDFSAAVRSFAGRMLNQQFTGDDRVVEFSKDADGIPFAILQSGNQQYISLSHDQEWIAFAYTLSY